MCEEYRREITEKETLVDQLREKIVVLSADCDSFQGELTHIKVLYETCDRDKKTLCSQLQVKREPHNLLMLIPVIS